LNFNHGRCRFYFPEIFTVRPANLIPAARVGDEPARPHHIVERGACRDQRLFDFLNDKFCLLIVVDEFYAGTSSHSFCACSNPRFSAS